MVTKSNLIRISELCLGLTLGSLSASEKSFKVREDGFDKLRDPFTAFVRQEIPRGPNHETIMYNSCAQAEQYFKERRFKDAENACNNGLEHANIIKDSKPNYDALVRKLTCLKKAAGRMVKRYETEDALEKLKLETAGILGGTQAVISINANTGATTRVVRVGDKILDAKSNLDPAESPIVREIQKRRIMIDFRGYKIELPISSNTEEVIEAPK